MKHKLPTAHFPLATLFLLLFTGCSYLNKSIDKEKQRELLDKPAKTGTKIRIDGSGLSLGEALEPALTPSKLRQQVEELLKAKRFASTRLLIARYPDVALELLLTEASASLSAANPAVQAIAQVHDQQCLTRDANPERDGWYALCRAHERGASPNYITARQEFWHALREGRLNEALASDLADTLDANASQLLHLDVAQLTATAHLLNEQPKQAVAAFRKAISLATNSPHQHAHLQLLLSEAERRSGNAKGAIAAWTDAIEGASQLALSNPPLRDPIFWERAVYLQPVKAAWPRPALERLQPLVTRELGLSPGHQPELLVWSAIAYWRLDRREPQAALLAFKRAESLTEDNSLRDRLQLGEARSLMLLNQDGAATAILVRLSSGGPEIARPAMCLLGTLKLRRGGATQGYQLLKKALDGNDDSFPRRDEADADYALAHLMIGDEVHGSAALQRVQQRFASTGDTEQLLAALDNQVKYLRQMKKDSAAKEAQKKLDAIERE